MKPIDLPQHISRQFDADLEDVRNKVLKMGGFVEKQIERAIEALMKADSKLGEAVGRDDDKVNAMERDIDEECNTILVRRQPAASDLRFIIAVIKIIAELERLGDEADKIGFLASSLASMDRPANGYHDLQHMGRQIVQMVRDVLNAFARLDSETVIEIAREDEKIDHQYETILRNSIAAMTKDPDIIRQLVSSMWIARSLERCGDHVKNICEHVIYVVRGQDVRHTEYRAR